MQCLLLIKLNLFLTYNVANYNYSLYLYIAPGPVSDVTVRNESSTPSTLTLTWMEITLTNSMLIHYTVFYLPVRGPYGPGAILAILLSSF